jgi:hypothetical protein
MENMWMNSDFPLFILQRNIQINIKTLFTTFLHQKTWITRVSLQVALRNMKVSSALKSLVKADLFTVDSSDTQDAPTNPLTTLWTHNFRLY